jgi:hypothetical protein
LGQNAAHVLGGELGVLVDEIETDRPAVDDWQRMAQLKSGVALIADVVQAQRFRDGFLIALDGDAIRAAVVFAAEMPQRLQRADFVDRLTNGGSSRLCSRRASKQILRWGEATSFTIRIVSA